MQTIPIMRPMQAALVRFVSLAILLPALSSPAVLAQSADDDEQELKFEGKHRVNAHGNEFNGLVKSPDGQLLFVGTEKGYTIVWNIAAGRVERKLHQSSTIHLMAGLAGPREFVAAGSNHFQPRKAEIRKWDVTAGASVELQGVDKSSFPVALTTEPKAGLIALTTLEGAIHVWDATSNSRLATWTIKDIPLEAVLIGRDLYVMTMDRESSEAGEPPTQSAIVKFAVDKPQAAPGDYLRIEGRTWTALGSSADHRLLTVTYEAAGKEEKTVLIDPASKVEVAELSNKYFAWIDSSKLVLFDWKEPVEIVQLQNNGRPPLTRKLKRMDGNTRGGPLESSGLAAGADGTKAWASFSKGGSLVEFDLVTSKIKTLLQEMPGAYSISVETADGEEGHLLTGGADGYVRFWKLSDISLIKEYPLLGSEYIVSQALLLSGARRAVVCLMRRREEAEQQRSEPVEVVVLDLQTGQHKSIAKAMNWRTRVAVVDNQIVLPEGDRIRLLSIENGQLTRELRLSHPLLNSAVSANRRWLAVIDDAGTLTVFDLTTFTRRAISIKPVPDAGPLAITNDGRHVYVLKSDGQLASWNVDTSEFSESTLKRIREMHTRADFMTLANDDKWVVTAGNHGDVGIFERTTSRLVSYTRVSAAFFYVEKVWVRGDRVIFTTDTGVLLDGRVIRQ